MPVIPPAGYQELKDFDSGLYRKRIENLKKWTAVYNDEQVRDIKPSDLQVYNIARKYELIKKYLSQVVSIIEQALTLKSEGKSIQPVFKDLQETLANLLFSYNDFAVYIKAFERTQKLTPSDRNQLRTTVSEVVPQLEQLAASLTELGNPSVSDVIRRMANYLNQGIYASLPFKHLNIFKGIESYLKKKEAEKSELTGKLEESKEKLSEAEKKRLQEFKKNIDHQIDAFLIGLKGKKPDPKEILKYLTLKDIEKEGEDNINRFVQNLKDKFQIISNMTVADAPKGKLQNARLKKYRKAIEETLNPEGAELSEEEPEGVEPSKEEPESSLSLGEEEFRDLDDRIKKLKDTVSPIFSKLRTPKYRNLRDDFFKALDHIKALSNGIKNENIKESFDEKIHEILFKLQNDLDNSNSYDLSISLIEQFLKNIKSIEQTEGLNELELAGFGKKGLSDHYYKLYSNYPSEFEIIY